MKYLRITNQKYGSFQENTFCDLSFCQTFKQIFLNQICGVDVTVHCVFDFFVQLCGQTAAPTHLPTQSMAGCRRHVRVVHTVMGIAFGTDVRKRSI